MATHYNKPPLPLSEQAQLLLDRGLGCNDKTRLESYLSSIGYYRLSAYWLIFEEPCQDDELRTHQFISGSDFDTILKLYIFDRKLRLLLMEAIERIEVALRAQWSRNLALHGLTLRTNNSLNHCGSHAYMNPDLFKNPRQHIQDLAKIDREFESSKEVFIEHYKGKYSTPPLPPIWVVVETMSLGMLSRWFQNTKDTTTKKAIMRAFGMPTIEILESVFHALTPVRNICAHHSRLWNRCFAISLPKINRMRNSLIPQDAPNHQARHLYNYLVVIDVLMRAISPNSSWKNRLMDLLTTIEPCHYRRMGFPDDWKEREPWKNNTP
jgi:abortive infection bacteriophage resistance protein